MLRRRITVIRDEVLRMPDYTGPADLIPSSILRRATAWTAELDTRTDTVTIDVDYQPRPRTHLNRTASRRRA